MKGRYSGRTMTIYGSVLPGAGSIALGAWRTERLTEQAKRRIKVFDWWRAHGKNSSLAARHFALGRMTLYRWLRRFAKQGVMGFNEYSKRPKNVRRPTTPWTTVQRAMELRRQYPAWSKHKIRALLFKEGIMTSVSTVGRILKRKGLINPKASKKRRKASLHPRTRFPRGLSISEAGDMVQIDTKYIMLPGGRKYYQFTAIDVLSKRRVLRVYPSQSSRNGALFLGECLVSFPFLVKAIQTDNGAPFLKEFEKKCQELGLPHYFIYPRSPKQNSYVEISHGADEREFYQQGNCHSLLSVMQRKIQEWEDIWNMVRPHASLNYFTPHEYLDKLKQGRLPTRDTIVLQA